MRSFTCFPIDPLSLGSVGGSVTGEWGDSVCHGEDSSLVPTSLAGNGGKAGKVLATLVVLSVSSVLLVSSDSGSVEGGVEGLDGGGGGGGLSVSLKSSSSSDGVKSFSVNVSVLDSSEEGVGECPRKSKRL